MFVTGGELLQFLPISSKKRVGMSICFFGHLKEEKYKVLRNKWTPLQIVITNGYTCSIFQVAKITRKTEITKNNTESLTHLLFIILKLNIINRKFCKYCIYFISSIV